MIEGTYVLDVEDGYGKLTGLDRISNPQPLACDSAMLNILYFVLSIF